MKNTDHLKENYKQSTLPRLMELFGYTNEDQINDDTDITNTLNFLKGQNLENQDLLFSLIKNEKVLVRHITKMTNREILDYLQYSRGLMFLGIYSRESVEELTEHLFIDNEWEDFIEFTKHEINTYDVDVDTITTAYELWLETLDEDEEE